MVLGIKSSLTVGIIIFSFCQVVFGLVNCSCSMVWCYGSPVEPDMDQFMLLSLLSSASWRFLQRFPLFHLMARILVNWLCDRNRTWRQTP